jgi:transposase-like protein
MEIKLENLSIFEFQKNFSSDEDCRKYLYDLKWSNGFTCRRCGHTNGCKGNGDYSKKCTRCNTQESATAHTLFHKCKFSLLKAFWIVYYVSTTKSGISSMELSRKLNLRQKTAWLFKRKVMQAMKSSKRHPMKGEVEVDEFVVGGKEEGVKGRKSGKKKKVVIAIERKSKGVARIYTKVIEKASKAEILPFVRDHIDKDAKLKTDKWTAYKNISNEFPNHSSVLSENGKNFNQLHRCIMMIKSYIRGTYHSVSDLQSYLDEYCYRYNRHRMKNGIFENLMAKMVYHNPVTYKDIRHA